jgi:phosphatidylglycerol---prolipoprotein diacylglyceryl transferase
MDGRVLPLLADLPLGMRIPLAGAALTVSLVLLAIAALFRRAGRRWSAVASLLFGVAVLGSAWSLRGVSLPLQSLSLRTFGVLLFAGLAGGWWLGLRRADALGLDRRIAERVLLAATVGGLLGARLAYVLIHLRELASPAAALALERGGLSGMGGVVGAVLAARVALGRRAPALRWGDVMVEPALLLGVSVALGAYGAGADGGVPLPGTAPAWLTTLGTFPRWRVGTHPAMDGPPVLLEHISAGLVPPGAPASAAVHPVALYEALVLLAVLAGAAVLRRRQRQDGGVVLPVALLYGTWRFISEGLRADSDRGLLPVALASAPWLVGGVAAIMLASALARLRSARGVERFRWAAALAPFLLLAILIARVGEEARSAPSAMQLVAVASALAAALALGRPAPA